nr:pilus assembly protein TadG-related protein [Rhabdothermincola salaria]
MPNPGPRTPNRTHRDDRGVAAVLVAGFALALVLVAALAIDGGQAYANRRQMQNASDAAAMAGAAAFATQRSQPAPGLSSVTDQVRTVAEANGADVTGDRLKCWFVDDQVRRLPIGSPVDICGSGATWASANAGSASGVEVETSADKETFFAQVGGIETVSARTEAAATLQPLVGTGATFPFIMCGVADSGGFDILDQNLQVRPEVIGSILYPLQDPGGGNTETFKRCDGGSNTFKGKGDGDPAIVGEWTGTDTGNDDPDPLSGDFTPVLGSDACPANTLTFDGCLMVVPLASNARGTGSNAEVYIVGFSVFEVYSLGNGADKGPCEDLGTPNPKFCGYLVGGQVEGGITGGGPVGVGGVYAIKLAK